MAVAHTDLGFVLSGPETQARAGDPVHFSITGAQKLVSYELEVGDKEVLEGSAVSGQFTMPDLGQAARTVTVEAELRGPGKKKTTVKRKFQYLGPALEAERPSEAEPVVLPPVPQQAVAVPAPVHTPAAAVIPAPRPPPRPRSPGRPRRRAATHASVTRSSGSGTRRRDAGALIASITAATRHQELEEQKDPPHEPHRCSTASRSPGPQGTHAGTTPRA